MTISSIDRNVNIIFLSVASSCSFFNSFFPDAKDSTDAYVSQFMKINMNYNKGVSFDNVVLQGMNSAMLTVQALRAAGKNLTRTGLIEAVQNKGSKFASAD